MQHYKWFSVTKWHPSCLSTLSMDHCKKHKHPCPVKTHTAATKASVNPLTSFFFCYQFCFDRSHTAFTVTHRSGFSNVRIKQARPANSDGALICRVNIWSENMEGRIGGYNIKQRQESLNFSNIKLMSSWGLVGLVVPPFQTWICKTVGF